MCRQKSIQMWKSGFMVVFLLSLLSVLPHDLYAQEDNSSVQLEHQVFLPLIASQADNQIDDSEQLIATFSISVGENGEPIVTQTQSNTSGEVSAAQVDQLMPIVVIIPDPGEVGASSIDAIACPWGGTGATRIGSGWFQNPPPDYDFYVDYKLPKNFREATVCITAALWAALRAKGKTLAVQWYSSSYDSSNWRTRIIIGSSVVRDLCSRLVGNPNCGNWLLQEQAKLRYRT